MKLNYHDFYGYNDEWLYEKGSNGWIVVLLMTALQLIYAFFLWIGELFERVGSKEKEKDK